MTKRFFILLLALVMTTHLYGCSSSDSKGDGDVAESNDESFSEEGEGDFAEEEGDSSSGGDELSTGDETKVADEAPPADDGGSLDSGGGGDDDLSLDEGDASATAKTDEKPADQAKAETAGGGDDELSLDEPEALPEEVATNQDPGVTPPGDTAMAEQPAPPPSDEPLFKDDAPKEPELADAKPSEPPPVSEPGADPMPAPVASYAPLLKMKDAPFTKNGANLNRVYVARPGDTAKSVSTKIYGSNRSKDLKSWNPILQNRPMKTGDKIYYQSAKSPEDTRMITYYEDVGATPQTYVTKEGDNIRTVSKSLLGNKDSWKEIWATNPNVESKGDVPAGVELRYWPDGADAGMMASAQPPPTESAPPPDMGQQPPPTDVAGGEPPPQLPPGEMPGDQMPGGTPTNMASNDFPPPGDVPPPPPGGDMNAPGGGVGSTGAPPVDVAPPPPPPPPPEVAPPPPPPPPEPKPVTKKPIADLSGSTDPDTMMAMGFGGILLICAALLFIVIRKNRAKRVDLGQTQV